MILVWLSYDDHLMIIFSQFGYHRMIIWWSSINLVIKDRGVNHMMIIWLSSDFLLMIILLSHKGLVCKSYDYYVNIKLSWSHDDHIMIIYLPSYQGPMHCNVSIILWSSIYLDIKDQCVNHMIIVRLLYNDHLMII